MKNAIVTIAILLACNACHRASQTSAQPSGRAFGTPQEAADALITAAAADDVPTMLAILGPEAKDLIASPDSVQDKTRAAAFAAKAREKNAIEIDPNEPARGTLVVGNDDWPLPIPIVMNGQKWRFDTAAGHDEVLKRRIGANELDVITICRGYVEAQKQYASEVHDGSGVNQYALRVIATPGKQDGLAWKNADGSWGGPVGQAAANAIEQGYAQHQPFHGYYFKTLMGQGSSARLGKLDYVVGGVMIGGFAMVAWPAEYGVTGVQTFIVSYDGVVDQKDLGPRTAETAAAMDRYDPDVSWKSTNDAL